VQDCIRSQEFYRDEHFVLLNYTCRCAIKNPRVKLNDEGREFRWLELVEAKKMKLNKPTKILIEAVLKNNSEERALRVLKFKKLGTHGTRPSGRK